MPNYTLTFTADQLRIVNDALVRLPYAQVAPLIQAINDQIRAARLAQADSTEEVAK
ncbi:hypothetical protein KTE54_24140 [Burkholderia multivorans]|uniref:hypothetical protein n=1 Tax=Burkholderia multivorans TaxID=87883 RepID=UPI001C26C1F7|nr:hypothetical protein [Burkholderia multivorans]MBU9563773.1 hypothetical protein [Burkholderia multivorans]